MTSYDIINGRKVPGTVLKADNEIHGKHQGSVTVIGCTLIIFGTLQGSLALRGGATVIVQGIHQGSISVSEGSSMMVRGKAQGSVHISVGSKVIVESSGTLSGSMKNEGELIIRGVFGGSYLGSGIKVLEGSGYIKEPRIVDGVHYYEW